MMKGSNLKAAKPIFESQIFGSKVTRFDQTTKTTGLLYFTSYKDVERIHSKFEGKSIEYGEHEFEMEPYYHCCSHEHNRLLLLNQLDTYYRRYLDGTKKEILYPIQNIDTYQFLLLKTTHMKVLQSDLEGFGNVELDKEKRSIIISPLLVSTGGGSDYDDDDSDCDEGDATSDNGGASESTFEATCHEIVGKFLAKFVCKQQDLDQEKLDVVRKMGADPKITEDYDGSDQDDISVNWRGNKVKVLGVSTAVDSFIELMIQLVDITNNCMNIEPGKYRWLMECKVFEKISKLYKTVSATKNDSTCQITFKGKIEEIGKIRCDILAHTGNVHQKNLDWNDVLLIFLKDAPELTSKVLEIFRKENLEAIIDVESDPASIWAYGKELQTAESVLKKHLYTDASIELSSEAHREVTKLPDWQSLVEKKRSCDFFAMNLEQLAVVVAGFRSTVETVVPNLKNFLTDNLQRCLVFKLDYIKACYIKQFCQKKLEFPHLKLWLDHNLQGIIVVGKMNVLEEAKTLLEDLCQKIKVKPHSIQKHAIVEFFSKDQGELIISASSQTRCTILVEKEQWPSNDDKENFIYNSMIEDDFVFELSCLTVSVIQSNIPWDESDAVVCVAHTKPPDRKTWRRGKIRVESVANLPSKKFLHITVKENEADFEDYIQSLLEEAEKLKCKSIAMLALTSGQVDHGQAAKMLLQALHCFTSEFEEPMNLANVKVLIQNPVKFKEFTDGLLVDKAETLQRQRSVKPLSSAGNEKSIDFGSDSSSSESDDRSDVITNYRPKITETVSRAPTDNDVFNSSTLLLATPFRDMMQVMHHLSDSPTTTNPVGQVTHRKFGSFRVTLRPGSITDEYNDMIVNSLGSSFNLSAAGEVSSTILREGGSSIQTDLDRTSGTLCRVTGGGDLRCQKILHLATPGDVTKLKGCVIKCLQEAENQRLSSISLPAIGTGGLGMPAKLVAEQMHHAIEHYTKTPNKYLRVIDVVVFQRQMMPDFLRFFPPQAAPKTQKKLVESGEIGCLKVSVQLGDITEDTNEMIVTSVSTDFDLSKGEISGQLLKKGGRHLQMELLSRSGDEMRVTDAGGDLHCRKILHLVTPNENGKLQIALYQALMEADKRGCESISFSALGTGHVGVKSNMAATAMSLAIKRFSRSSPLCLRSVDIVLLEPSKAKDYVKDIFRSSAPPRRNIQVVRNTKRARKRKKGGMKGREKTLVIDSIRITIREGDIIYENSDVIVNNAVQSFELSKGKIRKRSYGLERSQIKSEIEASSDPELRVTSGGDLRCEKVFHAVFPNTPEAVKTLVVRMLREMKDGLWTSISMLPPGGGKQAASILNAVVEFAKVESIRSRDLVICVVATKENIFDHLNDVIIADGRKLPGAKVLYRPTIDIVNLILCCDTSDGSVDEAIKRIENKVEDSYDSRMIPCPDIDTFRKRSWDKAEEIQHIHKVEITITKKALRSFIVIKGIKEGVWNAKGEIEKILSKMAVAESVTKLGSYSWQYIGVDHEWQDFAPQENKTLEELYQGVNNEHDTEREMFVDGKSRDFVIDIDQMTMTGYRPVKMRRNVVEELPRTWSDMGSETIKSVALRSADTEYQRVKKKFQESMKQRGDILSIVRIQNKNLYGVFEQRKKAAEKNCRNETISQELFHGTKSADLICKHGFDRAYSGSNVGAIYGKGNYFAKYAAYSANGYATPDQNGICCMILAEVITGDFVRGDEDMKTTPPKAWDHDVLYESLVDNEAEPEIFIVFHDASVYPSYVIKFRL